MKTFKPFYRFLDEDYDKDDSFIIDESGILLEKLITFGGKRENYNQVVIMMGGAASGKGFVRDHLLGIQGKVYDVDYLKEIWHHSATLKRKVEEISKVHNIDINEIDLKDSKHVTFLHLALKEIDIHDKRIQSQLLNVTFSQNKPNLIFDVTLKSIEKLSELYMQLSGVGYEKENIHIVWVVNDIETALEQNRKRDRSVSEDILKSTHKSVANIAKDVLTSYISIRSFMDGDFWIVFNKAAFDTLFVKGESSDKKFITLSNGPGGYIKDALYFKVKEKRKDFIPISEIDKEILQKLKDYTKVDFS